ncbi:MAG TPA: ComEC/Rec2 family competence protein [Xanthomonadales bacterium]|nr:ComEC/Rec2 family competence protein [Xanthomonadales bacterium]
MSLFFHNPPTIKDGQELNFRTRLTDEPEIKNGRQKLRVKTEAGQRIIIITGLESEFQYGDTVDISGNVKTNVYKGHTFFTMNTPTLQIATNDHNFITGSATSVRRFANNLYSKSLPPVSASLLSGIVFGGDQGLPKNFMEDLQVSGVVHVIAASGMNVTFVAGAMIGVLGALFKRQIAITIAIFGVLFYAFISGLEPSIVRASIMAIMAFSAQLLGRQSFALASLFITAFVMLFYSPVLVTDVGFQLSFLATLGILLIKPILSFERPKGVEKILFSTSSNNKKFDFGFIKHILLSDDVGTTIAAQIATIPVLLAVFGNYGLLSIFINALVLWTVPLLMIIGSIGLLVGFVFEPLGGIFLFLAIPVLFYFEKIVSFFGNLGWTMSIPAVSISVWIGYYLIVGSFLLFMRKKKSQIEASAKGGSASV